jgi:hypothetical protein
VKTPNSQFSGDHLTPPLVAIVGPRPIYEVAYEQPAQAAAFSHGLGHELPLGPSVYAIATSGVNLGGAHFAVTTAPTLPNYGYRRTNPTTTPKTSNPPRGRRGE